MDESNEIRDSKIEAHEDPEGEARREFLKKVAMTAATAPAVAMLLSASAKPAKAQALYDPPGECDWRNADSCGCGCGA